MSEFTTTTPTGYDLPGSVSAVGGVVLELVGLNGARVISQLAASELFKGYFDTGTPTEYEGNPGTIGIQDGFGASVIDALGGGLQSVSVRITLSDGDTASGNFDYQQNTLELNGVPLGNFSDVTTEETQGDGTTIASGETGFPNNQLNTGWFYSDDPTFLDDFYQSLVDSEDGTISFQLFDNTYTGDNAAYDPNYFDFTQGLNGGLIDVGSPPNVSPVLDLDSGTSGTDVTLAYTENDAATLVAPDATVTDTDSSDFDTGSLVVAFTANGTSNDQLTIDNVGTGTGEIGVNGSDVTYENTAIGTFAGGSGGTSLTINFNSAATPEAVEALTHAVLYSNSSDDPSAAARELSFTLSDGDGGSTVSNATINVTAVNDAPVLSDIGPGPVSASEQAYSYLDQDASVSDAELSALNGGAGDFAGASLTITRDGGANADDDFGFNTPPGTLFSVSGGNLQSGGQTFATFSDSGGTLTVNFTSSETAATTALVNNVLQHIVYADQSDAPPSSVAIHYVFDDGNSGSQGAGGAGTGTADVTVTIQAVDDAPVLDLNGSGDGLDVTVAYTEGDGFVAIAPSAAVSDVDSPDFDAGILNIGYSTHNDANQLSIQDQGTGSGQIGFDGTNVTYEGDTIGAINSGNGVNGVNLVITFNSNATPLAVQALTRAILYSNTSDAPVSSVDLTIVLTDGHGNGALGSTTQTATIDITAVNDPPSGADNTVTTNEDTAYTFGSSDFGFTDPDTGDALQAVRIDTLSLDPDATLQLNGIDVTAGQVIAAADIANLVFLPGLNENGSNYSSFTFSVQDDSGSFSASPNTFTFDVTPVNDPPSGADNTVTTNEDTAYTFSGADFGFTDPDSGDAIAAVRIDTLPLAGTLSLDGNPVHASDVIAAGDIGLLVFTPGANENGSGYASFSFSVEDSNSAFSDSPNTLTFDVTPENDAPSGTDKTVTIDEDTPHTFSAADFGFTDPDSGDLLYGVRIDSLSLNPDATLQLFGTDVTAGQTIDVELLDYLVFTPGANENGTGYSAFTFSVEDSHNTFSDSPNTLTFDVTPVNDPPSSADNTITTNEDTAYTFGQNDFGFTDPDTGDALQAVRIDTLSLDPDATLQLNGIDVTAGQVIAVADIANLVFLPGLNENGSNYSSFTFSVQDDNGSFSASPNTFTFDVTPVNDPPSGRRSTRSPPTRTRPTPSVRTTSASPTRIRAMRFRRSGSTPCRSTPTPRCN